MAPVERGRVVVAPRMRVVEVRPVFVKIERRLVEKTTVSRIETRGVVMRTGYLVVIRRIVEPIENHDRRKLPHRPMLHPSNHLILPWRHGYEHDRYDAR